MSVFRTSVFAVNGQVKAVCGPPETVDGSSRSPLQPWHSLPPAATASQPSIASGALAVECKRALK